VSATPAAGFRFKAPQDVKPSTSVRKVPQSAVTTSSYRKPQNANLDTTAVSTGAPKKRPGWDLKGRLEDMEKKMSKDATYKSDLQKQLSAYNNRIEQLECEKQQLSGDVQEKAAASERNSRELDELQRRLRDEEDKFQRTKRELENKISDLDFEKSTLHRQKTSLESDLEAANKEIGGLKSAVAELTAAQSSVRAELDATKSRLSGAQDQISSLTSTVADREASISAHARLLKHKRGSTRP